MADRWIRKAIKKPGALRETARRMGLLKGKDDKLSEADLDRMERAARRSGNVKLLRRVLLARTLRKMRR